MFWFGLRLRRLSDQVRTRLSESQEDAEELNQLQSVETWIVSGLQLFHFCFRAIPTIWFSLDRKRRSHTWSRKKMETFWFFRLRFRRAYDSAYDYDSDLRLALKSIGAI